MNSAEQVSTRVDTRWFLGLAMLVLIFASAIASAAGYTSDCVRSEASLLGASANDATLSISVVDLTDEAAADMAELEKDRAPADESNSATAPHLYLGPRVASIARDVFGDEGTEDGARRHPVSVTVSPLAQTDDDKADQEHDVHLESYPLDDRPYSPLRIHREMYRTDI